MLEIVQLSKAFGSKPVLQAIDLAVASGQTLALLGPSGCGKTTLLRIIAGLEQADSGAIRFAEADMSRVSAHRRGFGLVFQDYALFPHLDVAANVGFGLVEQGLNRVAQQQRIGEMLELVGLRGYERRRVYELSGGERQRVALARALAPRPRLLMFDEPLAALDRSLRERLQSELRAIIRRVGVTAIYVTHDQSEAFALADQVALLNQGQVVQHAAPEQLYREPANLWAAQFLGLGNVISGRFAHDAVESPLGRFAGVRGSERLHHDQSAALVIYPDAAQPSDAAAAITATITAVQFRGQGYRTSVTLRNGGAELHFEHAEPLGAIGNRVGLQLDPQRMYVLAEG